MKNRNEITMEAITKETTIIKRYKFLSGSRACLTECPRVCAHIFIPRTAKRDWEETRALVTSCRQIAGRFVKFPAVTSPTEAVANPA